MHAQATADPDHIAKTKWAEVTRTEFAADLRKLSKILASDNVYSTPDMQHIWTD